jgi:hypothetical protein
LTRQKDAGLLEESRPLSLFYPPQQGRHVLEAGAFRELHGIVTTVVVLPVVDEGETGLEYWAAPMESPGRSRGWISTRLLPFSQALDVFSEIVTFSRAARYRLGP